MTKAVMTTFPRRFSPTHFLALPVAHAHGVVNAIERVQAMLVQHNSVLAHSLVESITAHLTLLVGSPAAFAYATESHMYLLGQHALGVQVIALDDEHSIAVAKDTLCSFTNKVWTRGALHIHAKGLSHFRNQAWGPLPRCGACRPCPHVA